MLITLAQLRNRRFYLAALVLIVGFGILLRLPPALFAPNRMLAFAAPLHPQPKYLAEGFDEHLYREYVDALTKVGLASYWSIVDQYREAQADMTGSILPPVRFLYIFAGYFWQAVFGGDALSALKNVAALFSVLTLVLAVVFAWRVKALGFAVIVGALTAVAPTQLHMSQHALVDGFFTFWALLCLWLLWENLHAPKKWPWLVAYLGALALLVLTKENSFFVWVALLAVMLANRWLRFGEVTRELLIATVIGPLIGAVVLTLLAGGIPQLVDTYRLSVTKNYSLPFAIRTGDGPWHRYLVDLMLVSPVILLLAIGAIFLLRREERVGWFFAVFIAASYLVMCNVKYGMNLRYANIWDVPLRMLAGGALLSFAQRLPRFRDAFIILAVGFICAYEFRQYIILCVDYPMYELVSEALLRALHILKTPVAH